MALFEAVLQAAGDGTHHIALSIPLGDEVRVYVIAIRLDGEDITHVDGHPPRKFFEMFQVALSGLRTSGMAMRTTRDAGDVCMAWRIRLGLLEHLSAAECFDLYCTDANDGSPVAPEYRVSYEAAPEIRL
ncbi:hypothetical protein [Streptomyces sp. NRRL F-5630]|uniref:hypothetical protein n=1 Tax=Streptomyces sp. NRRL F-5630 TaxID=1463864 RepID=UPI003D720DED